MLNQAFDIEKFTKNVKLKQKSLKAYNIKINNSKKPEQVLDRLYLILAEN